MMKNKALLVVSFGTTYAGTRQRTIGAIERALEERFPDRDVCRAWTSTFIIKKVAKAEGLSVDTPEEALEKLTEAGVADVIVQPTHLSDGYENRRMMEIIRAFAGRFERIAAGRPLLDSEEDRSRVAKIMGSLCREEEALLLMGHGSAKHPVPVYEQLQDSFDACGADNVFVGTVEGTPTFEDAKARLDRSGLRQVRLAPLMIVAGDHAVNDLAGEAPDSWQKQLEAAGYRTEAILAGLGEYKEIQDMFAEHAEHAVEI